MKPENIEFARRLKAQAIRSTIWSGAGLVLSAALMLWLRQTYFLSGPGSIALLLLAGAEGLLLIPLIYSLRKRLQEIEGGEEYEACQY